MTIEEIQSDLDIVLSYRVGSSTIGENLRESEKRGDIKRDATGMWSLARPPIPSLNWAFGPVATPFPCGKLVGFLFRQAYGQRAVPLGCRNCFKVQIQPRNLRELNATLSIAAGRPHAYKAGVALGSRHHSGPYSTLFYLDGLESARSVYRDVRAAVDAEALLGPDVKVRIRRGCAEYEVHCGPSDRFAFPASLEPVEASLLARLRLGANAGQKPRPIAAVFANWLQVAYQIGDATYRDFTGGQPLYPECVTYDPDSG